MLVFTCSTFKLTEVDFEFILCNGLKAYFEDSNIHSTPMLFGNLLWTDSSRV